MNVALKLADSHALSQSDFDLHLSAQLKTPRVLIIDDDPDVASILGSALEVVGCAVTIESSSSRAEEACRKAEPDLILLDMMMPGRSGMELIKPLNQIAPDAIVCIMTGLGDPAIMQKSLAGGAWNVLCKPYSLADLSDMIELSLRLSASLREEQAAEPENNHLSLEFPGDHVPAPADLARLIAVAAQSSPNPDIAYRRLPLLAVELMDNAVEHGTHGDSALRYGIELQAGKKKTTLTIWNTGSAFDGKAIMQQRKFALPKGKLSGLQLASALADDVAFAENPPSVTVSWFDHSAPEHSS